MPGGSAAQQSFIPEPQQESPDETANLLAADKARDAGNLRTGAANDNYNPYTEEPANDNNVPQEQPSPTSPEENNQYQNTNTAQQAQLDADQQTEIAVGMAASKQRTLQQIQRKIGELETELGELEKDLTDFQHSSLGGLLSVFQPRVNILIDTLVTEMKKGANNLADEQKVGYYTGLIIAISSLIGMLTAFKFLAAGFDAAFFDKKFGCFRLAIEFSETIIIPIIFILISPIYIPFLAVMFYSGRFPGFKGNLTQNINNLIEKLEKQRGVWQVELNKIKKEVTIQRQIKSLEKTGKQIKQQR